MATPSPRKLFVNIAVRDLKRSMEFFSKLGFEFNMKFTEMVRSSGEHGCGYEASLEAWYRFLIDPEPPSSVSVPAGSATSVVGPVDTTVLAQRQAFLRADSLVAIVMLTDENDCSIVDEGYGWLIARSRLETLRQVSVGGFSIPAIGRKPVAELRGWVSLLTRDPVSAARDGQEVLDFSAREPVTKWNAWHLRMLVAEGALFMGNKARAIIEARAALAMAPQNVHPGIQRHGQALAARIFAWADAHDESIALLEQMSSEYPMIGPAEITLDPLYAIPLAGNARYQELATRLDAKIARNQKWKDPE
jgi:hypothetical protein